MQSNILFTALSLKWNALFTISLFIFLLESMSLMGHRKTKHYEANSYYFTASCDPEGMLIYLE